jgi:P27 family predicted phage terminase small subunit
MGSRGPVPKPTSERSKAGRNTMYRKTTAATPAGIKPPASVAKIPAALGFWERTAPILIADGRLTPDRVDAFSILCHLHSEVEQLAGTVATEGWITATDKGQAASPVAKLLRDSRRDFVTLARDFGLTAAAAARIPQELPSGEEEGDEEDAVLAKLSLRT